MRPVARMRRFPAWLPAAVLAAGIAAGCATEAPPPQPVVGKPAPKAQATQPAPQKAAEPQKKPEPPRCTIPAGSGIPFFSFIREDTVRGKVGLAAMPPMQRYELGELKLVGILWTKKGPMALVEDAEGKGYSVTTGSRIGRAGGVVTRITEKEGITANWGAQGCRRGTAFTLSTSRPAISSGRAARATDPRTIPFASAIGMVQG